MSSLTKVASPILSVKLPSLVWPAVWLVATLVFFGFRGTGGEALDLAVQSLFWNGHDWLIPKDAGLFHDLAYNGPKVGLYLFAVFLIFVISVPASGPLWLGRRRAIYILLCLAIIPIVSTQLRAVTQMATPRDLSLYAANPGFPHLLLFEAKPVGYPSHAFPAGHASGGLALVGLWFAWAEPAPRRFGLACAALIGGWMGLYQIARGEHFLSHTLATAALAWLLAAVIARCWPPQVD